MNAVVNRLKRDVGADLFVYPGGDPTYYVDKDTQITLGDLHGNALKLLYTLIRLNVFEMTAYDYNAFKALYLLPTKLLNSGHIYKLNQILSRINVNKLATLRLLGDELCDRGSNDYFMLKIIEKLTNAKVPLEICFSNHGLDFIAAMESVDKTRQDPEEYLVPPTLSGEFIRSLDNLKTLIQNNVVKENEVLSIFKNCYKPCLRGISYSLSGDSISIYSHAPIGLETIEAMARMLHIDYHDETPQALAQTIDAINDCIQKDYIQQNRVRDLFDAQIHCNAYCGQGVDYLQHPITAAVWNREYKHLVRPERHHDYKIFFIHGHDMSEKSHANIYSMDDLFGKAHKSGSVVVENNKGTFQFLQSNGTPRPKSHFSLQKLFHDIYAFAHRSVECICKKYHAKKPTNTSVKPSTKQIFSVIGKKENIVTVPPRVVQRVCEVIRREPDPAVPQLNYSKQYSP